MYTKYIITINNDVSYIGILYQKNEYYILLFIEFIHFSDNKKKNHIFY
jgi:hypothetical protein